MHTFQLSPKHAVLFGLSWRAYDSFESRHGQIVEWQSQGHSWSATYKLGADTYVGLIDDSFDHPSKGNLYSAAALVALNPKVKGKTALILFVSGNEVALVGLLNGCIILDVCVPKEDAALHRNNFAQRCGVTPFITLGPQEAGSFDENFEWTDLISGGGRFGSALSKSKLLKFKSDRTAWVLVAIVGVITLAGMGIATKNYFDEIADKKIKEQQALANDPIRLYENSVQNFLNDPKGVPQLSSNIQYLRQLLGSLAINRGGWTLVKVVCDTETARCNVEWALDSTKVGTFKSFAEAENKLPNLTHVYGPSLTKISSTFSFNVIRSKLAHRSAWPKYQAFMTSEASRWQSVSPLGMSIEVKEPVVQAVQAGLQPQQVDSNPNAIHAASWSTTGKAWWLSEIFDKSPNNVTLDRLTLMNNGNEITFNAEGKIYVQKI